MRLSEQIVQAAIEVHEAEDRLRTLVLEAAKQNPDDLSSEHPDRHRPWDGLEEVGP